MNARILLQAGRVAGESKTNCKRTPFVLALALLSLLWALNACSKYNPVGTGDTTILAAPTALAAKLGPGVVSLSWQFNGDLTKLKEYHVYRRGANELAFRRVAIVTTLTYRDSSATIGTAYQYRIAAANKSNIEGQPSDPLTITPAVFGVAIGNGLKFVNRRLITLALNASTNTALMMIANDAAFTGAVWETFNTTKAWELTAGEGLKTVFVKFRTAEQAESEAVKTTITLDTIALINAITHDGAGRVMRGGDVLHLRLDAGEPYGNATVDLIDNKSGAQDVNLRLYDNGSNGDAVRDDGVYELDYRVRPDVEFVQGFAYGNFTDAAANLAVQRVSPTSFVAQFPPKAVTLSKPVADTTGLRVTWSINNEKDFANYRVYRSLASPVDSTAAPLTIINDNTITNYRDTGITPNTIYFYRVFVYDRSGLFAGSNEVQGQLKK